MKSPLVFLSRRELVIELENAIASGDETKAAKLAARMAQLRLNCSILTLSSNIALDLMHTTGNFNDEKSDKFNLSDLDKTNANNLKKYSESNKSTIKVLIEGGESVYGPIDMKISKTAVLEDLCLEAEKCFAIDSNIQRWLIGDTYCTDYQMPLVELAGEKFDASFYLCLVEELVESKKDNLLYKELVDLDEQNAVIKNIEPFECSICMEECPTGEGVVLRECAHIFCCQCLQSFITLCNDYTVTCPDTYCSSALLDREVHGIVSTEEYDKWLRRSLTVVESTTPEAFHCRTKDCPSWVFCEPEVLNFKCPVCGHINCVKCECIHEGQTCDQYESLKEATNYELHETKSKARIDSMVTDREAMKCPGCPAIISKSGGCDGMQCPACKTHLCWATRGARWGPAGVGDTTGGCKCGVNGLKCAPSCLNCH